MPRLPARSASGPSDPQGGPPGCRPRRRGQIRGFAPLRAAACALVVAVAACTPPASGPGENQTRPPTGPAERNDIARPISPPAELAETVGHPSQTSGPAELAETDTGSPEHSHFPQEDPAAATGPRGSGGSGDAAGTENGQPSDSSKTAAEIDLGTVDLAEFGLEGIDLENMTLEDLASNEPNPLAGCVQCHTDVADELEGTRHAKEEILCTDCHGPSEGHLADENNEVKPDERFARQDVDRLCTDCHDCSRPLPALRGDTPLQKRLVCTDCHGSHKLVRDPDQRKDM